MAGYGPLPNVPFCVKFVVTCVGNDARKTENIFHWGYTGGPPTLAGVTAYASTMWNAWVAHISPNQSSVLALTSVQCTDLSSSTAFQYVYTNAGTPVDGSLTGGVLPLSNAMLINKFITRLYRGGHPRSYLAVGDTTKMQDDGHFTTAFEGTVGTAYSAVQTAVNGTSSGGAVLTTEVTVSYIDKVVNPVFPYRRTVPAVFPVTSIGAQSQVATQRRRVRRTSRRR